MSHLASRLGSDGYSRFAADALERAMRQHGDVERHPLAELMDRPFKELVTLTHTALGECLTNAGVTSEGGLILSRLDVACAFDAVCFLEVIVALLPSITIARNLKGNP